MFPDGFIVANRISCNSQATSKKKLLESAGELFSTTTLNQPSSLIFDHLLERERLGSTGFGHGVAIPHARISGTDQAFGCFIHTQQGIDFDAIDNEPVDLIFALLVPEDATEEHLQLLSLLASMFSTEETRQSLRTLAIKNDTVGIIQFLNNFSRLAQSA